MGDGLELRGLRVGYGRNEVVHGVDLTVEPGARVAMLGANGAGKTTILRTISGLLKPTAGSITFAGEDLMRRSASKIVQAGVVHVPEGRHIFPNLTVEENLRIANYGRGDELLAESLKRIFTAFPALKERQQESAGFLSGGQQQMLALGRAIVARPRLLLLDEMSLGLAPILVKEFYAKLAELFSSDLTILIVEQNARMALAVSSYVYILRNGVVSMEGPPARFEESPELLHEGYLGVS